MYRKKVVKKNVNLLLIWQRKKHYVLIKYFNAFMYNHALHRGRKHFCRYCLQASSIKEILKPHIKDCFQIKSKQRIIMPKKGNTLNLEIMKEK